MAVRFARVSGRTLTVLCSLWYLGAGASFAVAQTTQTGVVQGRVSAADGRDLGNATVTLRQTDGSYPRTARTDGRGEFRIAFITPGAYTAEARLLGYQPYAIDSVRVRATETTRLDLTLQPAAVGLAAVNVTASPVTIDKLTTEFTSSLTARERELLPTARNANALIAFTPGARPDQVFGGSTTQANLYQLDGVSMNQPGIGGSFLLPSVDWLEDIRVIGLGAGAEYGNFQGGLINMVTKSGTNTLQGAARIFVESRALNATNINAFENGSELDSRREFNAEIRGPIRRDRLYYFVAGQEAFADTRVVDFRNGGGSTVAFLPSLSGRHEQKYYGKLTWLASPRDNVNASIGVDNLFRERVGLNGYDALDATYRGSSPSVFYQANWQRTFGNRDFVELKFSGYAGRDDQLSYAGASRPSVQLLDIAGAPLYANASFTRQNAPSTNTLTANYDRYFSTGTIEHTLKTGGEASVGAWRERRTRNAGISWYTQPRPGVAFDPLNTATWGTIPSIGLGIYASADTGGTVDLDASSRNAAAFVQDYIRIGNRVSIGLGARFGYWAGYVTPGNGGGTRGTATFQAVSATGIDPRIGATIDVTGKGDLVVKAHWGRYHQNLFALFFDRAPGANVFTSVGFCDWRDTLRVNRPDPTQAYAPAEFSAQFNCRNGRVLSNEASAYENYRQPYMDQGIIGIEKAIGSHIKAELLYVNRVNKSVLALVDKNLDRNWRPIQNVQVFEGFNPVTGPDGQPLVLPVVYVRVDSLRARLRFGLGGQVPGYTRADTLGLASTIVQDLVVRPVDEAQRKFGQLQAVVNGVYPQWSFNAAVAVTKLTGNLFSVNGYFDPNGEGNGPFVQPNLQVNYDGNLPNYSPVDAKLRISGRLPWRFEGGAFANVIAGDYWTPTYTIPRNVNYRVATLGGGYIALAPGLFTGLAGEELYIEPRGSRRFDAQATLDLRLQRGFRVRGTDLVVGAEVFNVFNGSAATQVKTSLNNASTADPSSQLGAVRLRQTPTTFRLNTQVRF